MLHWLPASCSERLLLLLCGHGATVRWWKAVNQSLQMIGVWGQDRVILSFLFVFFKKKSPCVSLLRLRREVIICPEHAWNLVTLMRRWSSRAGWFLRVNRNNVTTGSTTTKTAVVTHDQEAEWPRPHTSRQHFYSADMWWSGIQGALTFKKPGTLIVRKIFLNALGIVPSSPSACARCSSITLTLAPTIFTKACSTPECSVLIKQQ